MAFMRRARLVRRVDRRVGLLIMIFGLTVTTPVLAGDNQITGQSKGGDHRAGTLKISLEHSGSQSLKPCSSSTDDPNRATFPVGDHNEDRCDGGATAGAPCTGAPAQGTCGAGGLCTNMLIAGGNADHQYDANCDGQQKSDWSIKGYFDGVSTVIHGVASNSDPATLKAEATAATPSQGETTTSRAKVSLTGVFQADASGMDQQEKISKKAKADDATIGGSDRTAAFANASYVGLVNGLPAVEVYTSLSASGGSASIISGVGMTLPGSIGSSGSFSSTVIHHQDPAQNFSFDVTVADGILAGPDASNPGWTLVSGNWLLPEAAFPIGADITWVVPGGAVSGLESSAEEYDERFRAEGAGVPVLSTPGEVALVGLLTMAGSLLWVARRRRPRSRAS